MTSSEPSRPHIVDKVDIVDRGNSLKNKFEPLHPSWQFYIIRVLKEVWPGHADISSIADQLHVNEALLRPLVSRLLNDKIIIHEREGYRVKDYIRGDTGKKLIRFEDLREEQQERVSIMRHDGAVPEQEAIECIMATL